MRLHRLEIAAFGIFARTAEVDFDALHEAGLFLLTGPTGAGKSTVLDAICFALYGDIPGDRSTAKRFRSDLAEPGAVPRVSLELTLNGRRFRFDRSPAWIRAKKRGTGTTQQQASVRVHELVDDGWRLLTTRLDEAGHLASDLIGMSLTQFCQVAMLPQGQFQAFLRARSEDRHRLLAQLFRTERFELVERWLRDHRLALRHRNEAQAGEVASLVHRLSEAARTPLPESWTDEPGRLDAPAREGKVNQWCAHVKESSALKVTSAHQAFKLAATERDELGSAFSDAKRLADIQARHRHAQADLARLDGEAEAQSDREGRLDAALRAASLIPVLGIFDHAQAAYSQAEDAEAVAASVLQMPSIADNSHPSSRTDAEVRARRDDAASQAGLVEGLIRQEDELATMRLASANYEDQLVATEAAITHLTTTAEALACDLKDVASALGAAQSAAEELAALRPDVAVLAQRHQDAVELRRLGAELDRTQAEEKTAIDAAQQAKEQWLALREQRLSGMAAEIAQALVVGEDCPVCGSADHPHPAVLPSGTPLAVDEAAARARCDDLELTRFAVEQKVRDLKARCDALARSVGGADLAALDKELREAQNRVDLLSPPALQRDNLQRRHNELHLEQQQIQEQLHTQSLREAGIRATFATHREQEVARAHELAHQVNAAGSQHGGDLAGLADVLRVQAASYDNLLSARQHFRAANKQHRLAAKELDHAVAELGFSDATQARQAALPKSETDALLKQTQTYRQEHAALTKLLADPELQAAHGQPVPNLEHIESQFSTATETAASAEGAYQNARHAATRVAALTDRIDQALREWQPVRENLDVATTLASLVEGRSADNALQMRLSAFVLAHRLGQVVHAANLRLVTMSDHRYTLQHTAQRGAGETRGGLSLLVRDDWSGESRDPATLSGGETFVVSLALALGLADVLVAESGAEARGASRLESLFVDEGFGSLDANTLDDVLDTLDALREGGRVVGLVSHVGEMRDRIPAQLRIVKTRHGSTIRQPQ